MLEVNGATRKGGTNMAKTKRSCLVELLLCIPKAAIAVGLYYYAMWAAHNVVELIREYGL